MSAPKFLYAKSNRITSSFNYINWLELCELIRTPIELEGRTIEEAKKSLPVVAANDAPSKTKEVVLNHNNFTMLRLDLDDTKLELNGVSDELLNLGFNSFIIHTSANHLNESNGNRFRVFIEIASSCCFSEWASIETYLAYLFSADDCASRPNQIMYAPLKTTTYDYVVRAGEAFSVAGSELLLKADKLKAKQSEALEKVKCVPAKPQYKAKLIGKQVSIIDAVNAAYDWPSLLNSFGYKQQGKAWLPPESDSKAAGAYILTSHSDGKERYFSHHESDPCSGDRSIDKFDFITIREYSGDAFKAMQEIAKRYFPCIHKHNQEEYFTVKHNSNMATIRAKFAEVK